MLKIWLLAGGRAAFLPRSRACKSNPHRFRHGQKRAPEAKQIMPSHLEHPSPSRPSLSRSMPLLKQVLRQEARSSQAAFLSSVLPEPDLDLDASPSASTRLQLSPTITPSGLRGGAATGDGAGAAISSGDAEGSDRRAVARWASMRRLQEQSVGLGSAADHQLARALQLCRDLRGLKVRVHRLSSIYRCW